MARGVRGKLFRRDKSSGQAAPKKAAAATAGPHGASRRRLDDMAADAPLLEIARRVDIGAQAFVTDPRHSFDIDVVDLPATLHAIARSAAARGRRAYLQIPGRCLELTETNASGRTSALDGRPRLRLLTTDPSGHLDENVAIELWKQAERAYRSLSDDAHIRLSVPAAPPSPFGPVSTEDHIDFPIDVVYTWVDASDPSWRGMASEYMDLDALEGDLYEQTDELRYSLRSVQTFAPWVNHIHVLSNCGPPAWFVPSERVSWVDHAQVADADLLPLFNSGAIDTLLHRVPGLTEHFLYFNDDFMLWDSVRPSTFYTWDDRSIAHMATNSSLVYLQQLVDAGRAAPSQHSRVNGARLMQARFGHFPTRVHGHVPYALRRSVLGRIESDFPKEIAATRAARTRSETDTSFIAYLYHHYAYLHGAAVYADAPPSFVTLHNYQRQAMLRALQHTCFACFQDSRGSAADPGYQAFKTTTLEAAFPLPGASEIDPDRTRGAS